MKNVNRVMIVTMAIAIFWTLNPPAEASWGNLLQGVKSMLGSESSQNQEIVAGLKEALRIGADNSVAQVGQLGGYLDNPDIRIGLPGPLAKTENLLRFAGYGDQIDAFETSVNRAAELAAPQAKAIFWQAINNMTLDDAQRILNGGDTAATEYFARQTRSELAETFIPIVHQSLAKVDATSKFQDLNATFSNLPFGENLNLDLDQYVTKGALDGLFLVLGEEEQKIRQNPAARTTELLQKVFGAAN